jgi:hypothetical protein
VAGLMSAVGHVTAIALRRSQSILQRESSGSPPPTADARRGVALRHADVSTTSLAVHLSNGIRTPIEADARDIRWSNYNTSDLVGLVEAEDEVWDENAELTGVDRGGPTPAASAGRFAP